MSVWIKNAMLCGETTDVLIEKDTFSFVGKLKEDEGFDADNVINAEGMALLPAFYNLHCHAAMCLLRGYGEDMPLMPWLEKIWSKEATLTGEDIYNGTRLAVLEMIKSGTVFFADMYWYHQDVLRAVEDMGIRCNIGVTFMDSLGEKTIKDNLAFLDDYASYSNPLITFAPAPHAIYTCSGKLYMRCFDNAERNNLYFQTHLSETVDEVNNCKKLHGGQTPTQYLHSLQVLNHRTIAAHCVHLTEEDAEILAETEVTAVHNPCSNMKLSSGAFDVPLIKRRGVHTALGTDGCSSNNNLSMIEEMKTAALLAKHAYKKADTLTAKEVMNWATVNGAKAYGINAGRIQQGMQADCLLVDMQNERLVPSWDIVSDMVYSADSSCVDTVICAGKVLMEHRRVKDQEEIVAKARAFVKK
ncbi:MAG: amidohydrolase [Bacteroidales bacterium]|nr:amidohydrolase [Bacteroidales bacterium]